MLYRFRDYQLDPQRYALHQAGQPLKIEPKVFDVLLYLLQHRDRVVSKDELLAHVWPQQLISEATLNSCLMATRRAVGDSGRTQGIIQTVYGRGYRFIAAVEEVADQDSHQLDTLRCPACQHRMSSEALFCVACGQRRAEDVVGRIEDPEAGLWSRPVLVPDVRLCATCQHANPAAAIFCVACGTRLQQRCPHCGQETPLPAAFCTACGQSLAATSPRASAPTVGVLQLADAVPTPPSPIVLLPERKPITVLCCTVAIMAEGQTHFELEALHSLIQTLHALARNVMQPYGGRLSPVTGDHFLILFGVPMAQEDDAQRAVRVALALRQRVSTHQESFGTAYPGGVTLRMGVHTGLVVVEGRQDDTETVPTVVGDVLSLALVLQEQAVPGQILCSDATARLVERMVVLAAVGFTHIPGQSTPVTVYAVLEGGRSPAAGRPQLRRGLSPFIDREREMATLHALLAQAETGRGQMVGVVGEAGMGKSRLIAEFRRSLEPKRLTYLTGRCLSYGSMTPYLPVLEVLRHHCEITEVDGPADIAAKIQHRLQDIALDPAAWAPPLLHLLDVQEGTQPFLALSPEVRKARTLTALTQMCFQGSQQGPLILEVEDLHWIDASSDEWLTALVEQMIGVPLLVLVTYRPGYRPAWIDKSYVHQVALQPLTPRESLQVVQAVLPTAEPTTPLVPQLVATAEGNPFFLEELAQTVVEQGAEVSAPTIPETVQAVLLARIDRLPASARRLLRAAAVIGKDIAVPWLQAITEVPDAAMARDLRHLQAAEFLYAAHTPSTLRYTFKHVLTQEVAYQSLLRSTRRQYHARLAQVLEARFPEVAETQPELLAQHYTRGDQGAQAILYWHRAGQRAVERSANVEAISHFTAGLEVLKTLPVTPARIEQELALHLALGAPLLMLKGQTSPEVEDVYNRALALCQQLGEGERAQHFAALAGLWRYYITCGRFHKARELAEQCLSLAHSVHDPALLQEAHLMLGSILLYIGELLSAREHLEHGPTLYDPELLRSRTFSRATDLGVLCCSRLSWTLWLLGYSKRAWTRVQEVLTLAQQSSHIYSIVFARYYAALIHQCRGEARATQEQTEAVLAISREHGFVLWLAEGLFLHGWALAQQDRVEEGIAQMRQSIATLEAMGVEVGHSSLLMMLTEVYWTAGQTAAGWHTLAEARAIMDKNAEGYYAAELSRLSGELLLQDSQEQQVVDAEQHFQQAITLARRQHARSFELRAVMSLSRLWQKQGKRAEAHRVLAESYSWFTEGHDTRDLQQAKILLDALQ